jgi:hypothetical protein
MICISAIAPLEPCLYQIQTLMGAFEKVEGFSKLTFWCKWTPTTQQTNHPFTTICFPMVWHQVHVNFGGCCISGISGTLVTIDVDITPPNLLQQKYDLVSWLRSSYWGCCFGFGMHVVNDATWWLTSSCHCEQGGPTTSGLAHDYELLRAHMLFVMTIPTWFYIHDIFIQWNPMLMNVNVLWSSIPMLPKFLAYQKPSDVNSLVKSWFWIVSFGSLTFVWFNNNNFV